MSLDNPSGTVSITDLELAGNVAHDDILSSTVHIAHLTTYNLYDNTTAVDWHTKCSTTTTGPVSYLLQVSALHQCHLRYKPDIFHIPVTANSMSNDCSRL